MVNKLHPTRIDIPENARTALIGVLNARLADAVDLATQMKHAHWNVKGPNFIALHELFDTIHGQILTHIDGLAERVTAFGGTQHSRVHDPPQYQVAEIVRWTVVLNLEAGHSPKQFSVWRVIDSQKERENAHSATGNRCTRGRSF